jgi:hypothetical protein
MNLIKVVQSLEEMVYTMALWMLFLPKTFLRVLLTPGWAQTYVALEGQKEETKRHQEYMPPILFWLFIAVVPYFLVLNPILLPKHSLETRLLVTALILIGGPLGFSVQILQARGEPISRDAMKGVFSTQCLCLSPAYLGYLPLIAADFVDFPLSEGERYVFAFLTLGWLVFAEVSVLAQELQVSWPKGVGIFFLYLTRCVHIWVILGFLIWSILH